MIYIFYMVGFACGKMYFCVSIRYLQHSIDHHYRDSRTPCLPARRTCHAGKWVGRMPSCVPFDYCERPPIIRYQRPTVLDELVHDTEMWISRNLGVKIFSSFIVRAHWRCVFSKVNCISSLFHNFLLISLRPLVN